MINLEDPYGQRLVEEVRSIPSIGFGRSEEYQVHPVEVVMNADGINATLAVPTGAIRCVSKLTGSFNLMNIMAAVAVSEALQIPHEAVELGVRLVEVVSGRLERIDSQWGPIFVDYAHTPNALTNVLHALREITDGRIITIMGCGGDRDKGKRPQMGALAESFSDMVFVTSDNPRTENPDDIIQDILTGIQDRDMIYVEPDRQKAICTALKEAQEGDTVIIAGKGHETYQEINHAKRPFDDKKIARACLKELSGH